MSAISTWLSQIKASIKAHKWIWVGGAAVVLIAAIGGGLYFFDVFGPSGHAICKVAVDRAKGYGALSASATQDGSAKGTDIKDRKTCMASDGADKIVVTVDLKCKDLKNDDCLPIYSVEREDGLSLYQVRAVPNDADDVVAAAPAGDQSPPADASAPQQPAGVDAATVDADVEVAHPGDSQNAAQGAPPQQ